MKQLIILCAMLLITGSLHADEYDDFRQLPVEEKVRVYLEKFKYSRPRFPVETERGPYQRILIDEYPKIIPVLMDQLERAEMMPYPPRTWRGFWIYPNDYDRSVDFLDEIINNYLSFSRSVFKQEERARLVSIYRQKIHDYLTTYKVVDIRLALAEEKIEQIELPKDKRTFKVSSDTAVALYYKYVGLGYKGLRLDISSWGGQYTMLENATDEFDAFSLLSAEEKVRVFIEKFKYRNPLERDEDELERYVGFFYYSENPKEYIPILLDYFERTEMNPNRPLFYWNVSSSPPNYDRSFTLLNNILYYKYFNGFELLNRYEQERLASIYRQKIHEYLTTYKIVDVRVVDIEINIERIQLPKEQRIYTMSVTSARSLHGKYTGMGYKGLRLDLSYWQR